MSAQDQQNSDRIVRNIDYLQVLKNRWKEVFLVFLLVLVISVVVTFLMPPSYRATSQFQIKLPKPVMEIGQGGDVVASSNVTANYIPMQYSVLTSTEVLKVVSRKLNPSLHILGILLTMFDGRTNLSLQVAEEVKKYFGSKVFRTVIPRTVKLSEAPSFGEPILTYAPKSKGAEAYKKLSREVVRRD